MQAQLALYQRAFTTCIHNIHSQHALYQHALYRAFTTCIHNVHSQCAFTTCIISTCIHMHSQWHSQHALYQCIHPCII